MKRDILRILEENMSGFSKGQRAISKYITEENGEYTLTLPESQKTLKLDDSEDNFVNYRKSIFRKIFRETSKIYIKNIANFHALLSMYQ